MTSYFARTFNINVKRRIHSKQQIYIIHLISNTGQGQPELYFGRCLLSLSPVLRFYKQSENIEAFIWVIISRSRPSSGSYLGLPIYQGQGQGQVRRLPALSPLSRFCKLADSLGQGLLLLGQSIEFEEKFFWFFQKFVIFLKCFASGNFLSGNLY